MTTDNATCQICRKDNHKYKCPNCFLKYCSVPCFKLHKERECSAPEIQPDRKVTPVNTDFRSEPPGDDTTDDTEDKVPTETLAKLGESRVLKRLLENPALRDVLTNLDTSKRPDLAISAAMHEPIFTEMANVCLRIVEGDEMDNVDYDISDSD